MKGDTLFLTITGQTLVDLDFLGIYTYTSKNQPVPFLLTIVDNSPKSKSCSSQDPLVQP